MFKIRIVEFERNQPQEKCHVFIAFVFADEPSPEISIVDWAIKDEMPSKKQISRESAFRIFQYFGIDNEDAFDGTGYFWCREVGFAAVSRFFTAEVTRQANVS